MNMEIELYLALRNFRDLQDLELKNLEKKKLKDKDHDSK